ncbi:MAG TPA: SpoIIE family protein phosphatase [Azoarcus taiwanensis]|nr:SpoIIE family protein phosphatase [Azoarcus taiwanensis]
MSAVLDRLASLKARIFLALAAILGLVAVVVMAYSMWSVQASGVAVEARSIENVLRMAELAIRGEYRTLLAGKVALVQDRKARFREFDRVVLDTLSGFERLVVDGSLEKHRAMRLALEWLNSIRPVGGEHLLVFDRDGVALVHPDPSMVGSRMDRFTDFKGRPVVEAAWGEVDQYGEAYLIYDWEQVGGALLETRYGHFVAFPPWNWMVASVGDLDTVQAEADARLERFRSELGRTLGKVSVVGDGFVFVFDGDGQLVVPPPAHGRTLTADALPALRGASERGVAVDLSDAQGHALRGWATHVRSLDWYVSAVASNAAMSAPATALVMRQALVFAVGLGLGLVLAWVVASSIARPLARLGEQARGLSGTDFSSATQPPTEPAASSSRRDEIGDLARAFVFMETELYRNVRSLVAVTRERERIEGELGVARDIQLGLLPKVFPAFPERDDIDVHACLISAREIGGDLYDFHLENDAFGFTIGDVAGKGVPAALFMAITKTLMKAASENNVQPGETVREVNEYLSRDNPNAMFVTAFTGLLDCRTGVLRYANGGHNPPVIVRVDGRCEVLKALSGPALGAMDGMEYDSFETRLHPGDILFLYTDGVTEAMNRQDELYGERRLLEVLERSAGADAEYVVTQVIEDVARHAGDAEQSDDITVLVVRFLGQPQAKEKKQ